MKEASKNTKTLVAGAAIEGLKQGGFTVMEQFSGNCIKFMKDEIVDIFMGGTSTLLQRIERFFRRVWETLIDIIKKPLDFLKGIFEFIINAFSEAIRKIYNLARNIFDLGVAAWELYKGNKTMSKEELVTKISETIITSGCLIIWDALDLAIEGQLSVYAPLKPFAPYLAASLSAIGFGISSHYLCKCVPKIVEAILSFETGQQEAQRERAAVCRQLVINAEMNLKLATGLRSYTISNMELYNENIENTERLSKPPKIKIQRKNVLDEVNNIFNPKR